MAKKKSKKMDICCDPKDVGKRCSGCSYFLGVIGAAVYYISATNGTY